MTEDDVTRAYVMDAIEYYKENGYCKENGLEATGEFLRSERVAL